MHLSRPSCKRKGLRSDQVSSRGLKRFPRQLLACISHVIFFIFSITFQYLSMLFQHVPTSDARWARIGSHFFHAFVAFLVQNSCCWCWCWKALRLRGVPSFKNAPRGVKQGVLLVGLHGDWTMYILGRRDVIIVTLLSVLPCLEWCSLGWAVQKHITSPMTSK